MKICGAGSRFFGWVVFGAVVVLCGAGSALAQQPVPDPQAAPAAAGDNPVLTFFQNTELSGFVDMYYGYNFNTLGKPCATVGTVAVFNCLRNFDVAHNSFSLSLAEVALEKKPTADSRGGFRIDLDYGATTNMVHAAEPGGTTTYQNIQQAYISYLAPVGTGLQLDFGKFVTAMGNEVIESKDNWNHSRGLLFTLAIPYYHMGMRAAYSPNDKVTLMGHLVNGWNNVQDNNTGKSLGGTVIYKPTGAVTLIENYMGGPEEAGDNTNWRHVWDTVLTVAPTERVSLAFNYDYGKEAKDAICTPASRTATSCTWQGIAAYAKFQPNTWFAVVPRFEYFDDKDGFTTGATQKVKEGTLTLEFKHKDGVLMRAEYRRDQSDKAYFLKTDSAGKNTDVNHQDTLTFSFVYAFSSKMP